MRAKTAKATLIFFLLALVSGISHSQQADLSGTWVGTTEVPDAIEPDRITLVLEKEEGQYKGTLSDSMGLAQNSELEDVEFKDNTLTFNFLVFTGDEYLRVNATLKVEGDKMSGRWETEDGNSAPIELERKR